MPISRAQLTAAESASLHSHLQKHKIYPFRYPFAKTIDATAFASVDGSIGSYFTMTFKPSNHLGIVSIATQFVITPNSTAGVFALLGSYQNTVSLADGASAAVPSDEGNVIYQLTANGGSINDFQVFYPLNWYVEANRPFYMHVWADATTVAAGTSAIRGHFILGTLITGER